MFGKRNVSLKLTARAVDWINQLKVRSNLSSPIVKIGWARWTGEPEDHWMIGLYEKAQVKEGWLGIAPDFEFVVIQEWILDALDGKTLDVSEDGIVVE